MCEEEKEGAWEEWKDLAACDPQQYVKEVACGQGYKVQERRCRRRTGSPYCQDNGTDVIGDVIYRTVNCNIVCPGKKYSLISFNRFTIL